MGQAGLAFMCVPALTTDGNRGNSCWGAASFSPCPLTFISSSTCLPLSLCLVSHGAVHPLPVCRGSRRSPVVRQLLYIFCVLHACEHVFLPEIDFFSFHQRAIVSHNYIINKSMWHFHLWNALVLLIWIRKKAFRLRLATDLSCDITSFYVVFTQCDILFQRHTSQCDTVFSCSLVLKLWFLCLTDVNPVDNPTYD